MITPLPWDSKFFGYKIGKLENPEEIEQGDFDCVYIFSDTPLEKYSLPEINNPTNPVLVETRCFYEKPTCSQRASVNPFGEKEIPTFKSISRELVFHSRFWRDPRFYPMVHEYYEAAVMEDLDKMFVFRVFNQGNLSDVLGFVSLDKNRINLIAVDPKEQGKGIGGKLLKIAQSYIYPEHKIVTVRTQESNFMAKRFYEANGFCLIKKQYIYHSWSKKWNS